MLARRQAVVKKSGFATLSVVSSHRLEARTAAQVETAFQTEIHNYVVDGETHYANALAPSVPAASIALYSS